MSNTPGRSGPKSGQITLRYWAAAKAAAGVESDIVEAVAPVALVRLVEEAVRRHGDRPRLAEVLDGCSVLVGDRPVGTRPATETIVEPGATVEFLPPFAGG